MRRLPLTVIITGVAACSGSRRRRNAKRVHRIKAVVTLTRQYVKARDCCWWLAGAKRSQLLALGWTPELAIRQGLLR